MMKRPFLTVSSSLWHRASFSVAVLSVFGFLIIASQPCLARDTIVEYSFVADPSFSTTPYVNGILYDDVTTGLAAPGSFISFPIEPKTESLVGASVDNVDYSSPAVSIDVLTNNGAIANDFEFDLGPTVPLYFSAPLLIPTYDVQDIIADIPVRASDHAYGYWQPVAAPDSGSTQAMMLFSIAVLVVTARRFKPLST